MKRGQLTLELLILLLAVIVGGAIVATQIDNPNIGSGNEIKELKKVSMVAFSSPALITTTGDQTTGGLDQTDDESNISSNNSSGEGGTSGTDNSNQKPDLIPVSLIVSNNENMGVISKCWKENVNNGGDEGKLTNQFRHQIGECNNNTNVTIYVYIKNVGEANVTKPFKVALFDNEINVATTTPYLVKNNEWLAVFNYTISTSKGCKNQYQNNGNEHQNQNQNRCRKEIYNHTFTVVVDYGNTINESNEDNNNISVDIKVKHQRYWHKYNYATELKVYICGYAFGHITKNIIPDGKYISGDVNKEISGGGVVGKYNANGTISGKIKVNGNSKLYLGNLHSINALTLIPEGNSKTYIDVPEIGTLEIRYVKGGSTLELSNSKINTTKVTQHIEGNGYFMCLNDTIGNMAISLIKGHATLDVIESKIDNLHINRVEGNAYMYVTTSNISKLEIFDSLKGYSRFAIWDRSNISELYIKGMESDSTLSIGASEIGNVTIDGNMGNNAEIVINNAKIKILHIKNMNWGAKVTIKSNSEVEKLIVDNKNDGATISIDGSSKVGSIIIKK